MSQCTDQMLQDIHNLDLPNEVRMSDINDTLRTFNGQELSQLIRNLERITKSAQRFLGGPDNPKRTGEL